MICQETESYMQKNLWIYCWIEKRARQLATGGRRPTLEWEDDKPTVMALREIEAGTVTTENINDLKVDIADLEQEFSEELSAEDLPQS